VGDVPSSKCLYWPTNILYQIMSQNIIAKEGKHTESLFFLSDMHFNSSCIRCQKAIVLPTIMYHVVDLNSWVVAKHNDLVTVFTLSLTLPFQIEPFN